MSSTPLVFETNAICLQGRVREGEKAKKETKREANKNRQGSGQRQRRLARRTPRPLIEAKHNVADAAPILTFCDPSLLGSNGNRNKDKIASWRRADP